MKLFGFEIRRIRPDVRSNLERMIEAAEHLTQVWRTAALTGDRKLSPWISWPDKEVYITEYEVTRNKKN